MISAARLLPVTKALAAIATILGVLVLMDVLLATLSMGAPVFAGQIGRDAIMLAFIGLPLAQLGLVVAASTRADTNPALATKLYSLTLVPLGLVFVTPVLL